jgi:hypothetical protein
MRVHPVARPDNCTWILPAKSAVIGCALNGIFPVKRFCIFEIPVVFITDKFLT